ncbi:hypothetical protein CsatB_024232 [Cannabis sativa]
MEILHSFERMSGQKINLTKSTAFFSRNVSGAIRKVVCAIFNINEVVENSVYLGLPSTIDRNKSDVLGFLKEKMRKHIQRWNGKLLSHAVIEVLLCNKAQSLPTYAMSIFLLPTRTCHELEQLMANFW